MIFASSGCTALVLDPFILVSDMEYKIYHIMYIYIHDMLIINVSINEYISECICIYIYNKYMYISPFNEI